MGYVLGVDLGTTYSAAAVGRGGTAQVVALGHRMTVVPSAVLVARGGEVLVGAAALRRGAIEPDRLAREFKRRMGDSAPLILGGAPWSAEALTARLLGWIVHQVDEEQGGPPERLTVTYPANWGPFKQDRLAQALRMADLAQVTTLTEPEAAARWYAGVERVAAGEVVAVYDLGGGTFDASILRKTETSFEVLGWPEGIERLGGIDVDEAVFAHVLACLGVEELDADDPGTVLAVGRLRADCVEAKEALSSDSHVTIPVTLSDRHREVRLTRTELEAMVTPLLESSIAALRRAVQSAGLAPDDIDRVLLVGGTSRIPLVGRMVSGALGRPFFVDAHPKHAVCLGAALTAAEQQSVGHAPAHPTPPVRAISSPPTPATSIPGSPPPPEPAPASTITAPGAIPTPGPFGTQPQGTPTAPRPTGSRRTMGLVVGAAVLVAGLVAALLARPDSTPTATTSTSGDPNGTTNPTTTPQPALLLAGSAAQDDAASLAVVDDVWVAVPSAGSVAYFDRDLATEPEMIALAPGTRVSELVVADDAIWVAALQPVQGDAFLSDMNLTRIDPTTGTATDTVPLGRTDGEAHLTAGAGSVWLLTGRPNDATGLVDQVLIRIDPATAIIVAEIEVTTEGTITVQDIAAGDRRVWIAATDITDVTTSSGRILAVDPTRNTLDGDSEIALGEGPAGNLALAASGLWAVHWRSTAASEDTIVHLDPTTGQEIGRLPVAADQIAATDDWVWVIDSADGLDGTDDTVLLIEPGSTTVVDQLDVPGDLTGLPYITADGGTAWFVIGATVYRADVTR